MPPTRRQRRVAQLLHRELSSLLLFEARDPRLSGVNITAVGVTQDLLLARIYFSFTGAEGGEAEALAAMQHASGYLRSELAKRVQLRFMPELVFEVDRSAAYGRRIDELIDRLHGEHADAGDQRDS